MDKKALKVKFYPNKYAYASKLHIFFELKGVKISTVYKTLMGHGIPHNTIKTFLSGKHIPNSWITHLVEEIWGLRFTHEDFEPVKEATPCKR